MNLEEQFQLLTRRQLAIQEGIALMRSVQQELRQTRAAADIWGTVAVLANVTIIPLNVIVNSFDLKAAKGLYQTIVHQLYNKVGKSGTRVEGYTAKGLAELKKAIVNELKQKAMTDFIPGVNILVGLAEDSLAAWQAIQMVDTGSREMDARAAAIDRRISEAMREMITIGIRMAEILEKRNQFSRLA